MNMNFILLFYRTTVALTQRMQAQSQDLTKSDPLGDDLNKTLPDMDLFDVYIRTNKWYG